MSRTWRTARRAAERVALAGPLALLAAGCGATGAPAGEEPGDEGTAAARTEAPDAALASLLELATKDGSARAMVQLRLPGDDKRLVFDEAQIQLAQDRFLRELAGDLGREDRRVALFERIPFLALELDVADVTDLVARWPELSREYDVGPDVLLRLSVPASDAGYTLEQIVAFVQASVPGLGLGAGQTIVLVDSGLDPDFHLIRGRVRGGSLQEPGRKLAVCDPSGDWRGGPEHGAVPAPRLGISHGTQVATVAVGASAADPALRGIAPAAEVLSIRPLGGGTDVPTSLVAQSLLEVLCYWQEQRGLQVAAVSLSLGSEDVYARPCGASTEELDAIGPAARAMRLVVALLASRDVPVVVAAGNESAEGIAFPACLENTLAVVATDGVDERLHWSNWSAGADLAAPGASIAVPREGTDDLVSLGPGTSIAAPVVAGAIALLREAFPGRTSAEIVAALKASTLTVPTAPTPGVAPLPFVQIGEAAQLLQAGQVQLAPGPQPAPGTPR